MAPRKTILLGGGGHAKVVVEALRTAGALPCACLDPAPGLHGRKVEGVPVEGGEELLDRYPPSAYGVVLGVGAPKDTALRRKIFERLRAKGYDFPPVVAASALVAPTASLGAGAQILTRAVVHPGAFIGENAIVNTAAVVEHDCRVGSHAHIAPGALLCGDVVVEDGAFVCAGALVLPGVKVGAGALVAAGVVLRKSCPPGTRVLPGRSVHAP